MGYTALLWALANVVYGPITLKRIVKNPSDLFQKNSFSELATSVLNQ